MRRVRVLGMTIVTVAAVLAWRGLGVRAPAPTTASDDALAIEAPENSDRSEPPPIPSPSPTPIATSSPSRGAAVESRGEEVVPTGLEVYSVDPAVERYLAKLGGSAVAKRMLLSAVILTQHLASGNPSEMVPRMDTFMRDLREHRDDFLALTGGMGAVKGEIPAGVLDGIMMVTVQFERAPSPALQGLARAQVGALRDRTDLGGFSENARLVNAIAAYAISASDPQSALESARTLLNLDDPAQARAFSIAKERVPVPADSR